MRISFVGGGTDLPAFYEQRGGAVVSTSIDKWIHVVVARRFEGDIRVSYSRTEIVPTASELEHELVREGLRVTGIPRGIEVVTLADLPSGTGLGSSSTVMVGLLAALYAFQGVYRSPAALAEEAAQIEIDTLGKPIGRQDQYAAAVGGFNLVEFMPGTGGVRVEPIISPQGTLERVHRSMLLFYTGRQRATETILRKQTHAIEGDEGPTVEALETMRDLAYELRERLSKGDAEAVGELLDRNWRLKRSLSEGITNPRVDELYARAKDAGATGGKLLGAGSSGFFLISTPPDRHASVRAALSDLREVPFRFAARGTHIPLFEPVNMD